MSFITTNCLASFLYKLLLIAIIRFSTVTYSYMIDIRIFYLSRIFLDVHHLPISLNLGIIISTVLIFPRLFRFFRVITGSYCIHFIYLSSCLNNFFHIEVNLLPKCFRAIIFTLLLLLLLFRFLVILGMSDNSNIVRSYLFILSFIHSSIRLMDFPDCFLMFLSFGRLSIILKFSN